jgi:branched-chain amino acid transport system substrate-binding protein
MTRPYRRLAPACAVCVLSALVLAACGSSSSSTTSNSSATSSSAASSSSAPTTNATPAAAGTVSQSAIAFGVQYTGGKAGKADASLSPIHIGFTTNIGGSPSFPENVAAADATTSFINDNLGGIAGHPLVLDKCFMQSEEDGQKCGADFTAKNEPVVNQALAVIGNASLYKTLAGKIPIIIGTTSAGPDYSTPGAYSFTGGGPAVIFAMAKDTKNLGAKKVALLSVDNPGGKFTMQKIAEPAFKQLGVSFNKTVYYGEAPTTPDIVSALQAAGGSSADVIFFDPSAPTECISLYNALKQLGITKPVESTPICNAPAFIDSTGGGPENWRLWGFSQNPRVTSDPQVQVFNEVMDAYGGSKYKYVGFANSVVRDLLTIDKFMTAIGPTHLTPTALTAQIKAFPGPVFLVPGPMHCGSPPSAASPSVCGNVSVGSTYKSAAWQTLGAIPNQLK